MTNPKYDKSAEESRAKTQRLVVFNNVVTVLIATMLSAVITIVLTLDRNQSVLSNQVNYIGERQKLIYAQLQTTSETLTSHLEKPCIPPK